jgi:hypothetical protein
VALISDYEDEKFVKELRIFVDKLTDRQIQTEKNVCSHLKDRYKISERIDFVKKSIYESLSVIFLQIDEITNDMKYTGIAIPFFKGWIENHAKVSGVEPHGSQSYSHLNKELLLRQNHQLQGLLAWAEADHSPFDEERYKNKNYTLYSAIQMMYHIFKNYREREIKVGGDAVYVSIELIKKEHENEKDKLVFRVKFQGKIASLRMVQHLLDLSRNREEVLN